MHEQFVRASNLILLKEVLEYLISAGRIKVHDTTLRDETLRFIKRLTVAMGNTPRSVPVFSLQSSKRESLDYINLPQMLDHLAGAMPCCHGAPFSSPAPLES